MDERSTTAYARVLNVNYEIAVALGSQPEDPIFEDEHMVICNLLEQTTTRRCGKFERIRIMWFVLGFLYLKYCKNISF